MHAAQQAVRLGQVVQDAGGACHVGVHVAGACKILMQTAQHQLVVAEVRQAAVEAVDVELSPRLGGLRPLLSLQTFKSCVNTNGVESMPS